MLFPQSSSFKRLVILGGVARWITQLSDKVGLDWQDVKGTESERREEVHLSSFQLSGQAPRAFDPCTLQVLPLLYFTGTTMKTAPLGILQGGDPAPELAGGLTCAA